MIRGCTLSVQNVNKNTFLKLSCRQNSLLYEESKAFHGDAGPCWTQCFSQLCQVAPLAMGVDEIAESSHFKGCPHTFVDIMHMFAFDLIKK